MENKDDKTVVSVLMAVWNEKEAFLRPAVESVLNQTLSDFEFIIIDNGSGAETKKILEDYARGDSRVRLVKNEENLGLTKALNQGLALARGEFVARLDADDFSEKERLAKQLDFMRKNPDCVLCGTYARVMDENGKIIGERKGYSSYEEIKRKLIGINFFTHSSWFFRKSVIQSEGGYDERMKKAQDYDLLLRLASGRRVEVIPENLVRFRVRSGSLSDQNKSQEKYALRARINALKNGLYPGIYWLKIIRPAVFYFLVPRFVKKALLKILWKI